MEALRLLADESLRVLVVGLVLGAGVPAVFALGIRALAIGSEGAGHHDATEDTMHGSMVGKALAAICFLIVAYAIVTGILVIIGSGLDKEVSFEHVIPLLTDKE